MADNTSGGVRRVAVIGGNRIPFARSNTVYSDVSNQDMLTAAIDGFRWCLLGGNQILDPLALAYSLFVAALLLLSGVRYFRRTERAFADII